MAPSIPASPVLIRCKGILFDMDGILISSIGSVERSWTKWALLRGVDPALARKTAHGRRAVETIAKLRPDLDSEKELKVIEDIEIEDNEGLTVLPGVLDLLAALPADRWTVVTSATERLARIRMWPQGFACLARQLITGGSGHARQARSRAIPGRGRFARRCAGRLSLSLRIRPRERGRSRCGLHGRGDHIFPFRRVARCGALSGARSNWHSR